MSKGIIHKEKLHEYRVMQSVLLESVSTRLAFEPSVFKTSTVARVGAPRQRVPSRAGLLLREIHSYVAISYRAVLCTVMGSRLTKHIHIQVRELV